MKQIVISRTDSIGDVVLTLPLALYLKARYPAAQIGWIGKSYTKAVVESCKSVDYFLDVAVLQPEQLQHIDTIIFVFPDKKVAQMAKKANISLRIGTSHRWFHWIFANRLVNFSRKKSNLHEAQLNFKLLRPLGISTIPTLEELQQNTWLSPAPLDTKYESLLSKDKFNLIIHPKSKGSAREWSLQHYQSLIEQLPEEQFTIFITGTAAEREQISQENAAFLRQSKVKDVTGLFSLSEFISFIAAADGLVACSTGPLHIAAALGKYAWGLYVPMRPLHPARWQPIGKKATYFVHPIECSDCRKNPAACTCIAAILPEKVAENINKKTCQVLK
jgi:ADP-heptose:LPS heptosyltransferase